MRRHGRWAGAGVVAMALWCACGSDTRLAGQKLRKPTVKTVAHYGVTLDASATPQQVAYVLLRSIRDDVLAKTREDREAALDKQFDLCAADSIAAKNKTSLPRDQFIHNVVYHWAPTVAHYVGDFPAEWEAASERFVLQKEAGGKEAKNDPSEPRIDMVVAEPSGDPKASVVMRIWLAQESGYWRVTHLGFDPTRRILAED